MVGEVELNKETTTNTQSQGEILGKELVVADDMEKFKDNDEEESLHGDWLVMRRKKKGGKEKSRGANMGRNKDLIAQSLLTTVTKQVEVPNLINGSKDHPNANFETQPATYTPSGSIQKNVKKRARKEGSRMKEDTSIIAHNNNVTSMQNQKGKDVSLTTESPPSNLNSVSRPGPSSSNDVSELKKEKGSGGMMKGFDLGTEIVISPNLLGGVAAHSLKGSNKGRKPPDISGKKGANVHNLGIKSVEVGSSQVDRMDEEGLRILPSRASSSTVNKDDMFEEDQLVAETTHSK
ncbi:hypothetical protein RIF29_30630 [Crotalaria pallida]|uniref:Uncharacterized protein n=1 Tax=Crotalaria pallida TaxID=3830 RepID=A0AAN9EIQ3_CROPI